jgi:uncharacterized protein (TIGR00375 family)
MTFIADLHIHSRYSRATSRELCFEELYRWGRKKGVTLIGTGDCTHPGWLAEIRERLLPVGDGVFRLRDELRPAEELPGADDIRFLLTGEISTIYKADGATRKVHHLVCLPDLASAEQFAARLERIGNITSDGRPILGLDSRDLLEILLESSPRAALIPAHIWTPWFSVLGSKSGFDSVAACYRDLAGHIFAVETGLSSDPPMNWHVSSLDRYALVSNSDAHSAAKIGREANAFTCEVGYTAVMEALKRVTPGFWGTIEFFPEEGKYHGDGHRKCDFSCMPEESRELDGRCPVCGGLLTLGVEYRVLELADRPRGARPEGAANFQSMLSLAEILGELYQTGAGSKKVALAYEHLLAAIGPELYILREAELDQIRTAGGELLARAIEKMRAGKVHAIPGYDGEYGIITVFDEDERAEVLGQIQLFGGLPLVTTKKVEPHPRQAERPVEAAPTLTVEQGLSAEQQRAVQHPPAPLLIVAGPGAGKTRTLVERIRHQVQAHGIDPTGILALTFSNRAAREMAERLDACLLPGRPLVATFHKLGYRVIAEQRARLGLPDPVAILPEDEADALFAAHAAQAKVKNREALEQALALHFAEAPGDPDALRGIAERLRGLAPAYAEAKQARGLLDFADLLVLPLALLAEHVEVRAYYQRRWPHVVVDEYQDVNVLQYHLLRLLCPPGGDLCAIGDPDQAIYGFRGADVRYFLRFRQDYPDAAQIELTRNYRSSRTIVQASGQVIAPGSLLGRRTLWSDRAGPAIEVAGLASPQAEAEYVVQTIEGLLGGISHFSIDSGRGGDGAGEGLAFSDMAVLYRTHAMGEAVQQALERSGIPYLQASRKALFQRADVREVLGLLDPAVDLPAEEALLGICRHRGMTEEVLAQPPWTVLRQLARSAGGIAAFLRETTLEQDIDIVDPSGGRVSLMTVHAAKGLEWEVVFLVGCEDGSFPHAHAPGDEERRLFYVGMTRARRRLYLAYAKTRVQHGEHLEREVSPFVRDIEERLLQTYTPDYRRPKRPDAGQLALTDLLDA